MAKPLDPNRNEVATTVRLPREMHRELKRKGIDLDATISELLVSAWDFWNAKGCPFEKRQPVVTAAPVAAGLDAEL